MKFWIVTIWTAFLSISTFAQSVNKFNTSDLYIEWKLIDNNYKGQVKSLCQFEISNNGIETLPKSGWNIYFSYMKTIDINSVDKRVKVERVNGDLYRLFPSEFFKSLPPKDSLHISFVTNGQYVNFTDVPAGVYWVWDSDKTKGIALKKFKVLQPTENKLFQSPEVLYEQNKSIEVLDADHLIKVFPSPVSYKETTGSFSLSSASGIFTDATFRNEAEYLANEIENLTGKKYNPSESAVVGKAIHFQKVDGLPSEAYRLNVSAEEVKIEASSASGAFYAVQSLKTLMPSNAWKQKQSKLNIPLVSVIDSPRFAYRAFMLDVARNFHAKEEVLKVLDLMALYKLNILHFHLCDDEAWRLEIPSLPELTQIGAKRGHTIDDKEMLRPVYGAGPDVNEGLNTGFYSKSDFIEILRYADERHIQVIPEIETPGHARAAIKAMDARYERLMKEGKTKEAEEFMLRDVNDKSVYLSAQYYNDNVMCVAMPSVYHFLGEVVEEIKEMYMQAGISLKSIHFGGDEVPVGSWQKSPIAQQLIKNTPGMKTTDDLWYYYVNKLDELAKSKNIILSGWEEIALRKTAIDGKKRFVPNPQFSGNNFQVDVWNNVIGGSYEDLPYRLANAGYKVVLACVSNFYFDLAHVKSADEPGHRWGGYVNIDKPFGFIPFDYYRNSTQDANGNPVKQTLFVGKDRLTDYGKSNIIGIKGLLWTEKIKTPERLEYMLLPRLLGLAERAWAQDPRWAQVKDSVEFYKMYNQAFSTFANVIGKRELPRLDYYSGGYQYRIPPVGAVIQNGKVMANIQLPGFKIVYTTDGSNPNQKSAVYNQPIESKGTIKLQALDSKGRGGKITTLVNN
ncbi:family 20 glycosylhydrolase [Solitalea lacus]|uniref:family 20 glycosylhydrolase n=1 Tax=Solitalea lacus TaxID=2911172 RepID=UPI001EDC3573|nr:family 20 glycosylhydrolase [Solitalea lacus]UKJ07251.1 carbohydate-binding domain-containing protein [Solitalea lacus]